MESKVGEEKEEKEEVDVVDVFSSVYVYGKQRSESLIPSAAVGRDNILMIKGRVTGLARYMSLCVLILYYYFFFSIILVLSLSLYIYYCHK